MKKLSIEYILDQRLSHSLFILIGVVAVSIIALMHSYSLSRLQLILKTNEKNDLFIVSREKVSDFKKWIDR